MSDNYEKMKVPDLRKELSARGLQTSGKKDILVKRLRDHDAGGGATSPAPSKGKSKKKDSDEEDPPEESESEYDDEEEKKKAPSGGAGKKKKEADEGAGDETDKEEDDIPEDLNALKVPDLKKLLKKRKLSVTGTKSTLVERLQAYVEGEVPEKASLKRKSSNANDGEEKGAKKRKSAVSSVSVASVPLQSNEWKIVSWNVTSYNTIYKKGHLNDFIAEENPHIVCLNEIKIKGIPDDHFPEYRIFTNSAVDNAGYSGVAILTKIEPISLTKGIGVDVHDKEGRVITAEFADFYVVSSYVPNSGAKGDGGWPKKLDYRMEWDVAFQAYLKDLDKKKPVILCGDLNVAHKEIDLANPSKNRKTAGFTLKECDSFDKFLKSGFVDIHRSLNTTATGQYTFWSRRSANAKENNVGWRLDYFITSARLAPSVSHSFIRQDINGSDHCPIGIHVKTSPITTNNNNNNNKQ